MSKPAMPGHLIAVLIVLGLFGYAGHVWLLPLVMLLAAVSPMLGLGLVPVLVLVMFAWYVWLLVGLIRRQAWALPWTRTTAVVMCVLGCAYVVGAFASPLALMMGLGEGGFAVALVGWYLLWALGRADVREWSA